MKKFADRNALIKSITSILMLGIVVVISTLFLQFYRSSIDTSNDHRDLAKGHLRLLKTITEDHYTDDTTDVNTLLISAFNEYQIGISELKYRESTRLKSFSQKIRQTNNNVALDLIEDIEISFNRLFISLEGGIHMQPDIYRANLSSIRNLHEQYIEYLNSEISFGKNRTSLIYALLLMSVIIAGLYQTYLTQKYITRPANLLTDQADHLSKGDFSDAVLINRQDELGRVSKSLNRIGKHIRNIGEFIQRIGDGNFNTQDLNISKDDLLGDSLIQMQKKLKVVAEEDRRRNWINEGLTKFSEILRRHSENLKELSDELISNLTAYLDVNQASLYLLDEENGEPVLETISTYAWDRKKYINERFGIKENLIGQAIMTREMIYMTDVPDGFVHITSGLGKANTNAVIIIPLMVNEKIEGAIELASFLPFEEYKIEFIQKLSENIASTITNLKTNNQTRKLLEESQEMTEQLRQQEEELRQNTEELHVSQENLNVQLEDAKKEMQHQIEKIEAERQKNIAILEGCEDGVVTFKSDGIIDFVNKAAEEIWELSREEIQGMHIKTLMSVEIEKQENEILVNYLDNGMVQDLNTRTEIKIYNSQKEEISVLATLSKGKVGKESTFAFFIQRISVEIF